jgi:AraC-like DNA-binding protein
MRQKLPKVDMDAQDIQDLPQTIVTFARKLAEGEYFPFHQHRRAQLVYASSGVMTVTTRSAAYVVPTHRAVWMPPEVEHRIDAHRVVTMRSLYIDPGLAGAFPEEPTVLQVTPLLRELIGAAVAMDNYYLPDSPQSRVIDVILDQIAAQPSVSLALPLPTDQRLKRITQSLMRNPADSRILDEWSRHAGASKRTINRLFTRETGMTFRAWRQQLRLQRALELLAAGDSVTRVALEIGFDNTSAFIAMFRRCLGTTPTRYLLANA